MAEKCKECGCECTRCVEDRQQCDMHLHVEIENLRQRLLERDNHIETMETQFLNEAEKFPNGELASIKEEIVIWQDKYTRLYEAHKRVQKVNQNLEDKLLKIVDKCETEKGTFTKDIATLSHRLADANYTIHRLTQDNERYRNDVNLAIQLLQCKPANFVGQKYDSLPPEVQAKVRSYIAHKRCSKDSPPPNVKSIIVPISTFPPTAMVYNVSKTATEKNSDEDDSEDSKPPVDIVSAAIMAKVLEDREKERTFAKHCDTCTCHKSILMVDAECQTMDTLDSCSQCSSRNAQTEEKNSEYVSKSDKYYQNRSNQNSNSVLQKNNQDVDDGKTCLHNNSSYTKYNNNQYLCAKDNKLASKGSCCSVDLKEDNCTNTTKDIFTTDDTDKQTLLRINRNMSATTACLITTTTITSATSMPVKSSTSSVSSSVITGTSIGDRSKQSRANKNGDTKINASNNWNKYEKELSPLTQVSPEDTEKCHNHKERTHIDIINDRLWKNEWAKTKLDTNVKSNKHKEKVNNDTRIDIINDRVWKNNKVWTEPEHSTAHLTLIEMKNMDNSINQNECGQTEVATSPSFSSDSAVISTSDPSSSSSDIAQSPPVSQQLHSASNSKKFNNSDINRVVGPRNCFVRVTPGSKNILLDNVGHCKTMLYTSGNNKPNTALVHNKKLISTGTERSPSSTSEENSPLLLQDSNQLQRVAEWVQSSACVENSVQNKFNESKAEDKSQSCLVNCSDESLSNYKISQYNHDRQYDKNDEQMRNEIRINCEFIATNVNAITAEEKEKDLITFDVSSEEEKLHSVTNNRVSADSDYEVKITREMEETYLKLAASLDPVTLSLSDSNDTDLTIEKYRKNYKRVYVQRSHDKVGSTA